MKNKRPNNDIRENEELRSIPLETIGQNEVNSSSTPNPVIANNENQENGTSSRSNEDFFEEIELDEVGAKSTKDKTKPDATNQEETSDQDLQIERQRSTSTISFDGIQNLPSSNSSIIQEIEISTLKINPTVIPLLITEIVLSIIDLVSDIWGGVSLLSLKNKFWGIGSLLINWIPGLIATIQIIANYRCHEFYWIFLYSVPTLLLYPLIPTFTFTYLLYKTPRNSEEEQSRELARSYSKLMSFVILVRALEGCIESPIQLLYKIFLMFNGIINFDFLSASFTLSDLHENEIRVPFFINFIVASVTLLKSVYTLNVPFFKPSLTSFKYGEHLALLDFVAFLITSTLFKLGSLILLLGYWNYAAIIPMLAILFFSKGLEANV